MMSLNELIRNIVIRGRRWIEAIYELMYYLQENLEPIVPASFHISPDETYILVYPKEERKLTDVSLYDLIIRYTPELYYLLEFKDPIYLTKEEVQKVKKVLNRL